MDLKKLYKQKIVDEVFMSFNMSWSVLIHDPTSASIINPLFKKSDLLDYCITAVYSIGEQRQGWDLPAIYFVSCRKEVARKINEEFRSRKYSTVNVFSLCPPEGLDPLIKCRVIELDIEPLEERVFRCREESLCCLASILNAKFIISFIDCTKALAEKINNLCTYDTPQNRTPVSLLVLDRTIDLYTPLMYFFTLKSVLCEIGPVDTRDSYFKEIRNMHLEEVGNHLKYTVRRLTENISKPNNDKVDINTLTSMVFEAPKNIETKKNVAKYAEYLDKCISHCGMIHDTVVAQQNLVLGEDGSGNKHPITLDAFLSIIVSPSMSAEDRAGLLFLLKANGIVFTESEKTLLMSRGFSKEDLDIKFIRRNQILRNKETKSYHKVCRYRPVLFDVVESFATRQRVFQTLNIADARVDSLRRSTMISSEKPPRRVVVVYMKNGMSIEETTIAYKLTEKLGIEFIFGSDKVLTRKEFTEEYRSNKDLHETAFIKQ